MDSSSFWRFSLSYSARNLRRHPRRTLLLVATVVISTSVSIFAYQYADAVFSFWVTSTTESGSGHAQIHRIGYWDSSDAAALEYALNEGGPIENILESSPLVRAYGRRINLTGLVSAGQRSIYFIGTGVDSDKEALVSPRLPNNNGDVGRFVEKSDMYGVVVGKGLADSLLVELGDSLTLTVQTLAGALEAVDVRVRGIINYPSEAVSKRMIYMNLALAQKILVMPKKYHELGIRMNDPSKLAIWNSSIGTTIENLGGKLRPWWEIYPPMRKVEEVWRSVIAVISSLLFISASISVLNIIFLLVGERTVEVGTLKAIGAKSSQIYRLVIVEAALIGLLGSLLGTAVGNAVLLVAAIEGIPLPNPFFEGFIYIFPTVGPLVSLFAVIAALFVCSVAAVLPARKAASVEPVVAFRGQIV